MPAIQRGEVLKLLSRDRETGKALWAYRYRLDGRYKQMGGFRSKGEATAALGKALDASRLGQREMVTLQALVDEYLAAHNAETNTLKTLTARLKYATHGPKLDGKGGWADTSLDRLTVEEITAWRKKLPARSAWHIHKALRQLLHYAVRVKLLQENPAAAVDNPKPKRGEVQVFSAEELARIAEELGSSLPIFVAETGLRPEEWLALERRDLDRNNMLVSVNKVYTAGEAKPHTKTGEPRLVPLSDRALAAYDALPLRLDSKLVFPGKRGSYMDLGAWRRNHWTPAIKAAGLEHRSPYALRHSYISEALAAGIPARDVAEFAGTSISQIEETYGHKTRDAYERARVQLNARAASS
jgi:integrase